MKTLVTLVSFLVLSTAAQANDLISVPTEAVEEIDGVNIAALDPVPKHGGEQEFAYWVGRRVNAAKKNRMVELAMKYPYKTNVRCLLFPDAFGFDSGEDPMTMNCFAGDKKKITHVLTYQAKVVVNPASCNNHTLLMQHFSNPATRTEAEAEKMVSQCWVQVDPVKFGMNPLLTAQKISAEWLETELSKPKNENLKLFVTESKSKKSSSKPSKKDNEPDSLAVQEAD